MQVARYQKEKIKKFRDGLKTRLKKLISTCSALQGGGSDSNRGSIPVAPR